MENWFSKCVKSPPHKIKLKTVEISIQQWNCTDNRIMLSQLNRFYFVMETQSPFIRLILLHFDRRIKIEWLTYWCSYHRHSPCCYKHYWTTTRIFHAVILISHPNRNSCHSSRHIPSTRKPQTTRIRNKWGTGNVFKINWLNRVSKIKIKEPSYQPNHLADLDIS